jgi:hypothetical protein
MKMTSLRASLNLAALPLLMFAFTSLSNAQATRTWVSGVGDDANPCSRTAPCKTWAGAISKTSAGGEMDALDPGGFGAVTITKAITLDGGGGQVASVLVSGTNGIVVSAEVSDIVTLRNLRIVGLVQTASPGLSGVLFNSGAFLHIENCDIFGFSQNGVFVNVNTTGNVGLSVENTSITDILASSGSPAGINIVQSGAGAVLADVHNTRISNATVGLLAQNNSQVAVRDSQISNNKSFAVQQSSVTGVSVVIVSGSTLAFNAIAAQSSAKGAMLFSGNTITGSNPVFNQNGGNIYTGGDNNAFSNGPTGTTTAVFPKI